MAFMGILFFAILWIIKKLMIICSAVFLVAGLLLLKTHPIIAIILFVLTGLNLLGFIAWKIYKHNFKTIIETSNGEARIKHSVCLKYNKCVKNSDIEKVNEFLNKYHGLIYYKIEKCQTLLFYSLYHCNIDMMQCALKHSEKFNDPQLSINDNFLCRFFYYMEGNTTDEMIDTLHFALEHGAKVVTKECNLYEQALKWIKKDDVISPKDEELLALIKEYLLKENG